MKDLKTCSDDELYRLNSVIESIKKITEGIKEHIPVDVFSKLHLKVEKELSRRDYESYKRIKAASR